jgi:hypothetical protein
MLQTKAGYIDARPLATNSSKFSCYARPDHTLGQTRSFLKINVRSGLASNSDLTTDMLMVGPVPNADIDQTIR